VKLETLQAKAALIGLRVEKIRTASACFRYAVFKDGSLAHAMAPLWFPSVRAADAFVSPSGSFCPLLARVEQARIDRENQRYWLYQRPVQRRTEPEDHAAQSRHESLVSASPG
jgi:hypothetical protein